MTYICENEACRAVLEREEVEPKAENAGYCFYCPDCNARNAMQDIGLAGGPLELIQLGRQSLPHKIHATAVERSDGNYDGQVVIRRALGLNGPFGPSETFIVGNFADAGSAVAQARAQGVAMLSSDH